MKSLNIPLSLLLFCLLLGVNGIAQQLTVQQDKTKGSIAIYAVGTDTPLLTHHAREGFRPYIHPIVAPDGRGVLTEYMPGHHKHQTGLYWGFTVMNDRDYFRNLGESHWEYVSANVLDTQGDKVAWRITYNLLDEHGAPILEETQTWSMKKQDEKYVLDLEWRGKALTTITVGSYYAGGLFLRMPWSPGVDGEVVNAAGQRNKEAEAQRSEWTDVGIQVPGRDDLAHIAIFDHPSNKDFPIPWRVDGELGVGPCRAILGDWKIEKGETEVVRHRLLVYTGKLNEKALTSTWKSFINEVN